MKKRAVLKVLAMLLVFVMISSNVFAAADKSDGATNSVGAARTGGNVTIEVSGGATLNEDKTAVVIATQAVTGSSVAVSGYESITSNYLVYKSVGSQLDAVFGTPSFADGKITVALTVPEVTETSTYTIPASYFAWQNEAGDIVYSVEITVTATVDAETPTDPEEPTNPTETDPYKSYMLS